MISILIPVRDFDVVALVESMKRGLESQPGYGEILIGDDGSTEEFRDKYLALSGEKVRIIVSENNIGRAAIRNRLVAEAKGDQMLIVDADAMIPGTAEAYLQAWLPYVGTASVISGGILYREAPPGDPDKLLRWHYGRNREQKTAADRNKDPYGKFSTFNVLIDKSVFTKLRFNEELKQYGHEDTLFGYQLKKAGIKVLHIDNGLLHEGLETNMDFLNKTSLSIENLSKLYDIVTDKKTFSGSVRMLRRYRIYRVFGVTSVLAWFFVRYRERMEYRLDSSSVSLRLFNLYKMSMFCAFRKIHRGKNSPA